MRVGHCASYLCRLKGLSFSQPIDKEWGLLLENARESRIDTSIHMLGMRYDLGIVWIDANLTVVDTKLAKKWRSFLFPQTAAKYALEILPDRLPEFKIGDQITLEDLD